MRSVTLRLRFGEGTIHPMHAFVSDDDRYGPTRLLQWNVTSRETGLMVFRVAGPVGPYTDALDAASSVLSYETVTTNGDGDQFVVLVEDAVSENPGILRGYEDEDVVTIPPVVFHTNRTADVQFVGPSDALGAMVDRLPDGIDAEVRRLAGGDATRLDPSERLTTRQRRVLATAAELGYYDEPRTATLDEVAAELDLASGTVAEHVRKAEAVLVDHALGAGVVESSEQSVSE